MVLIWRTCLKASVLRQAKGRKSDQGLGINVFSWRYPVLLEAV